MVSAKEIYNINSKDAMRGVKWSIKREADYNKRAYVQKKDFKGKNWKRWK